jgi:protein-arginine kinase activator protein McsA
MRMKCQACNKHESQWELKNIIDEESKDPSYMVCSNCLVDLVNCNLKPKQFKLILSNGHDDSEFLLHGDFYDDEGNALQPTYGSD